ncbi:MAG: asparagine synthase (glutamine-hydrolyzing) [Bacteroidota bacterium]
MCGISGIVIKQTPSFNASEVIQKMSNVMKHRGPDGEGFLVLENDNNTTTYFGNETKKNVKNSSLQFCPKISISDLETSNCKFVFNHRRLAIIDVAESGHQPMCDNSESIWITYNGEIYNYLEIKKELLVLGHHFVTHSDTEVIIEAYKEWGFDCVSKFNGMWAFVLFDKRKNILFGSRDRFGVKPFYYYSDEEVFCFASEQKVLVKSGIIKTQIREEAVFDYFVLDQLEYEEEGMFKNVFELFPSHNFTYNLSSNEFTKWKYYELNIQEIKLDFNVEEKFRELFFNAIQLRMRSDVKVGSCLSGGLDSSSIVVVMNLLKNNNDAIELFTASYNDWQIDESNFAKQVVDATHSNWHQVFPSAQNLQKNLHDLFYSLDVPIWSSSTFAQYSVMKLANENNIKVLLDGQGGDELLGGYPHHYYYYWNELSAKNLVEEINLTPIFLASVSGFAKHKSAQLLKKSNFILEQFLLRKNNNNQFLNADFIEKHKNRIQAHLEKKLEQTLINRLSAEMQNTQLKTYLRCEDRCSMRFSVESRTPFADDLPLIEFLFSLPSNYKINKGVNKNILRSSLSKVLPKAIANRKDKMGYVTPHNLWQKELSKTFKEIISESNQSTFIRKNTVVNNFDTVLDKKPTNNLFKYVAFSSWSEQYFVK